MRVLASEIRKNLSFEWTLTLNSYVALVKSVNASAQYKMWMLPLSSSSKLWSSVSSLEFHLYSINGSRLGQIPLLGWRLWWRTRLPMQETEEMWVWSLGQKGPLEEGIATYFSVLPWRIPWTGAWRAAVHGVSHSWTRLKQFSMHALVVQWLRLQASKAGGIG